jgi:hypothetical protein
MHISVPSFMIDCSNVAVRIPFTRHQRYYIMSYNSKLGSIDTLGRKVGRYLFR